MSDKAKWKGCFQQASDVSSCLKYTPPNSATNQEKHDALNPLPNHRTAGRSGRGFQKIFRFLLLAAPMMACGQVSTFQIQAQNRTAIQSPISLNILLAEMAVQNNSHANEQMIQEGMPKLSNSSNSSVESDEENAKRDLDSCHIYEVKSLPGSHQFAGDFIETMTSDPDPRAKDANAVWGLTADLNKKVPFKDRAIYISKSMDGGVKWIPVARVDSKYFNAKISEGLRNGLGVSPGGTDFVITTQRGAFQVFPEQSPSAARIKSIVGPRVPHLRPKVIIAKREGDPVRAGVVEITADGKNMIVGYGYFDLDPQILTYHKDDRGSWIEDGKLPHLPTSLDIFSMQFDNSTKIHPGSLYVGTGDQAYRLSFRTMKWNRIAGVGPDSAIHGMTTVGGLHLAACWGVYNPVSADAVQRVTHASFLLHPAKDKAGPNIRAYGIEVDPIRKNREVLTAITGVYVSSDRGKNWKRINDLPEGEFHSTHFNADGTIIVSGFPGTFLANPFSNSCSPHLRTRDK